MEGRMPLKIAPSLMCADLLELRRDIAELERAEVDMFHIDVMDGHFVPNLALSFDLAEKIAGCTNIPLDLHLMVSRPESFVEAVRHVGAAYVSFHIEATSNPIRLARTLKNLGLQVGVALNPSTPAETLTYLVEELDYVLLMTVEPGFSGQKFIPQVLGKIRAVRAMLNVSESGKAVEVDGNLNDEWASQCVIHGASILVAGSSSVFREGADLYTACRDFRARMTHLSKTRETIL
jgi:ribulose-phosphate 3-epimerase